MLVFTMEGTCSIGEVKNLNLNFIGVLLGYWLSLSRGVENAYR